jgi:hypothetical protein
MAVCIGDRGCGLLDALRSLSTGGFSLNERQEVR